MHLVRHPVATKEPFVCMRFHRTFSDWDDPPAGFRGGGLGGPRRPGDACSFVQTLVVTYVATGWTECAPVLYREQSLLREVLDEIRRLMPFELLGFDTDNDTVFINETLRDYGRDAGIVFTRCRRGPKRSGLRRAAERRGGPALRRPPSPGRSRGRGRRCRGSTRRRGCTSASSSRGSSWHRSVGTAPAWANCSATIKMREPMLCAWGGRA